MTSKKCNSTKKKDIKKKYLKKKRSIRKINLRKKGQKNSKRKYLKKDKNTKKNKCKTLVGGTLQTDDLLKFYIFIKLLIDYFNIYPQEGSQNHLDSLKKYLINVRERSIEEDKRNKNNKTAEGENFTLHQEKLYSNQYLFKNNLPFLDFKLENDILERTTFHLQNTNSNTRRQDIFITIDSIYSDAQKKKNLKEEMILNYFKIMFSKNHPYRYLGYNDLNSPDILKHYLIYLYFKNKSIDKTELSYLQESKIDFQYLEGHEYYNFFLKDLAEFNGLKIYLELFNKLFKTIKENAITESDNQENKNSKIAKFQTKINDLLDDKEKILLEHLKEKYTFNLLELLSSSDINLNIRLQNQINICTHHDIFKLGTQDFKITFLNIDDIPPPTEITSPDQHPYISLLSNIVLSIKNSEIYKKIVMFYNLYIFKSTYSEIYESIRSFLEGKISIEDLIKLFEQNPYTEKSKVLENIITDTENSKYLREGLLSKTPPFLKRETEEQLIKKMANLEKSMTNTNKSLLDSYIEFKRELEPEKLEKLLFLEDLSVYLLKKRRHQSLFENYKNILDNYESFNSELSDSLLPTNSDELFYYKHTVEMWETELEYRDAIDPEPNFEIQTQFFTYIFLKILKERYHKSKSIEFDQMILFLKELKKNYEIKRVNLLVHFHTYKTHLIQIFNKYFKSFFDGPGITQETLQNKFDEFLKKSVLEIKKKKNQIYGFDYYNREYNDFILELRKSDGYCILLMMASLHSIRSIDTNILKLSYRLPKFQKYKKNKSKDIIKEMKTDLISI